MGRYPMRHPRHSSTTGFSLPASPRPFPLFLAVAAGLPVCGLVTVSLLSAVHSGFVFVAGFFAAVSAASGVLIGLTGLILRERPWWLFAVSLAATAALFYIVNGISIPP